MAYDAVTEAAVIAIPHEKWGERSLACVVPVRDAEAEVTEEQLVEFLADECPGWWLPDRVEFIDEIPKTSTNKLDKKVLRDQFVDLDIETDREASDTSDA